MQFLELFADEELQESFPGISATVISFCRKTELPVYITIAQALEQIEDVVDLLESEVEGDSPKVMTPVQTILELRDVTSRIPLDSPTDNELTLAIQLVRGHSVVEIFPVDGTRWETHPRILSFSLSRDSSLLSPWLHANTSATSRSSEDMQNTRTRSDRHCRRPIK